MNWLDLGIIIGIVAFVAVGIKQGLMSSILSNFSLSINCLLSYFLSKPVRFIMNKVFHVSSHIARHYHASLILKEGFATNLIEVAKEDLHSTVNLAINHGDFNIFSKTMFKLFLNKKNLYSTLQDSGLSSRTMADIVSETFASFYVFIISFVSCLVFLFLLVKLFQFLATKLRTIGFVKTVDNTFGALYGVFRCFIVLLIACVIIKVLSPFSFMDNVISYINGSFFGRFIYKQINDFINNYLSFSDIIAAIFRR